MSISHTPHTDKPDDREAFLETFLRQHSIDKTVAKTAAAPIYWVSRAIALLNIEYLKHSNRLSHEPTLGLLRNMVQRAYEQVEGALVTLVTGCGSSSEVAARAALELSASILYILSKNRNDRLLAYFVFYVGKVDKEVKNWRALTENMPPNTKTLHLSAINNRTKANDALRLVLARLRTEFGPHLVAPNEKWPANISNLFKDINKESTYRTVYARLCSQTHGDAEETLRYFIGVSAGSQEFLERMGIETWNFSRLMVFIASSYFISAVGKYAETFGMVDLAGPLELAKQEIDREMKLIALNVGAF